MKELTQEMLDASHKLQPWRPDSETQYLHDMLTPEGIPFCFDCADWHPGYEPCSATHVGENN